MDFLLWSAVQWACSSLAPCTSVVRVLCQALEPTAFPVHPVLAPIAEDAVAAHSRATDGAWKLAWTLQEIQARTADHDLRLSCIYSQSFLFHCFFPSQEPPDTFLERFSNDNKVICIEVLLERNSRDKASSTMMKRSGLSTEPWWTPTFTSNSKLYPSPTRTRLRAFAYIPCTSSTPSFLSAHQMTFRGTRSKPSPGLRKPCRVSFWQLDTSLAAAWQQRLRLLCLCLGRSQTGNLRLTPTVWWGRPQSSPGLSWPALSAWDRGKYPFPMHPPFPCRGRQWNSAPSQRVPCHRKWLQLRGHRSGRRPCHRLLVSSPPLCLPGPVLCQPSSVR